MSLTTGSQSDPTAVGRAVHALIRSLGSDPDQVTSIQVTGNRVRIHEMRPPIDGLPVEVETVHRFTSPTV